VGLASRRAVAINRVAGDAVCVEATVFADGHERRRLRGAVAAQRHRGGQSAPMVALATTAGVARSASMRSGRWNTPVCARVDPFLSWRHDSSAASTPTPARGARGGQR